MGVYSTAFMGNTPSFFCHSPHLDAHGIQLTCGANRDASDGWVNGTDYLNRTFTYDALGRLSGSAMSTGGQSSGNSWSERNISYDLDGNLLHLDRYQASSSTPDTSLGFTVSGNRRTGWGYDANGNVTLDPLRNFEIRYNLLNLASEVRIPAAGNTPATDLSSTVFYADGTRAGVIDPGTGGWISRYIGSLIYSGSNGSEALDGIQTEDGFIDCSGGVSNAQMQYLQYLSSSSATGR